MKIIYNQNLKKYSRDLLNNSTLSEVLLWKEIKGKKLGVQFLRQKAIGNYIVDFYCSKLNFAIEIDGVSHDAKVKEDETRDKILGKSGIKIIRFRDIDIKTNLESVVIKIEECIKDKNPSAFGHSL